MGFVQRRLVKCVVAVVSWPRLTVAICCLLLVGAVIYAKTSLSLSTDQNALLTPDLPFFKEFLKFDSKFPENEAFVVLVEPRDYGHLPPTKRWIDLAEQTKGRLLELKGDVKRVDTHVDLAALGNQALLFDDWEDIRQSTRDMQRFLPLLQKVGQKPGAGILGVNLLGQNFTRRFYAALSGGPADESLPLALVTLRSLNAAVDKPPATWTLGNEIPNLTDVDPAAAHDPGRYGYYMIPDESKRNDPARKNDKIMLINIYDQRDFSSLADVTEPLTRMRAAVADVARNFPEFKVGMTGRPALEADEMRTSDHDTKVAEVCGLSLVFIMLWIFLRRLWLVVVAEVCLGVGIGWTFGWATLAVGRLNLLSLVFVIALIGIGMDYLIQILTRYRFEKRRYVRPQAIWARVFRFVSPPISTACLGAAGAFFVASFTNFKGAAELGLIAGGGLLLCLTAGYTLLPALLTLWPSDVGKVAEENRYHDPALAPRAGGWRLAVPIAWVTVAVAGALYVGVPGFDPNLLKLQATGLESVALVHKLPTWSAAVMATDLAKLRRARAALSPFLVSSAEKKDQASTILKTDSILDAMDKQAWLAEHNQGLTKIQWQEPAVPIATDLHDIAAILETLPAAWEKAPAEELAELRTLAGDISRKLTAPENITALLPRLDAWQKAFWSELRRNALQFTPGPLDLNRLPDEIRDHYVSYRKGAAEPRSELEPADEAETGKPTYALYIYPKDDLWEQGKLEPFVHELESRTPILGKKPEWNVTGIAVELLYSTQEIHKAFLLSTLYAVILILILVMLDLRRLGQTLLAISVLALGLPMLIIMMALWRWLGGMFGHEPFGIPGTWNFANFFGLPILIGAGHEYGVFMVHRYRETLHDPRRIWKRWDVSDRALLLCAIVTSCSFGFLMMAQHRGLASLGWVMAVGSACIYLATVLVLRPILQWRLKAKNVYTDAKARKDPPTV